MKEEIQTPDQAVLEMVKAVKEVEEKAAFYGCTFVWAVALYDPLSRTEPREYGHIGSATSVCGLASMLNEVVSLEISPMEDMDEEELGNGKEGS